jgi:hypothetical protein
MSQSKARTSLLLKALAIGVLPFTFALNASAQNGDRIDQLEKELLEIKLRLTKLEASQGNTSANQSPVVAGVGSRSLANWRKLQTGMSPSNVRGLIGEPNRIDGGVVAYWYYENGAYVVFAREKVLQWIEPQQN